jgi:hypothetical protein
VIGYAFASYDSGASVMDTVSRTSGTAIASLIFGVLCWVTLPVIGAILAVILGANARSEIRRARPGTIEGDGLALAGLILGWVHLAIFIAIVVFAFLFFGGFAFLAHLAR